MKNKMIFIPALVVLLAIGVFAYVYFNTSVTPQTSDIPTSADNAPEGSIHNLPVPEAVAAVKSYVAEMENVEEGKVIIMSAYEKDWSDSCLGLGGPAESCLAAITPGYEVTVQVNGEEKVYRTNSDGSAVRQE